MCEKNILDVRYIKLHFQVVFPEDCQLPASKGSALRGGIGEMMLRANCIQDRNCSACGFESECLVQRTMYSKFDRKPAFITSGDSVGYVIECEDYNEFYISGSELKFNLILFGKTIVYFNNYLQAIAALGQNGLGKYAVKFYIQRITNTEGIDILYGNNIRMGNYKVHTLADYVRFRKERIQVEGKPNRMVFKTPATIKYQGEFLQEFKMEAIVKSVQRRVYMLDCFENIDGEAFYQTDFTVPDILGQKIVPISVRRFSTRQEQSMWLKGIKGIIDLDELPDELVDILLAGEILHIGKNTSFGFGRYRLKRV